MIPTTFAHRTFKAGLVAAAALIALASAAPVSAAGSLEPVAAGSLTKLPYRGTVVLSRNGSAFCTGFLIKSNKVATAAHCLVKNPHTGDYRPSGVAGLSIFPGYSQPNQPYPGCNVTKSWGHPNYIKSTATDTKYGMIAYDYGVLTLDCKYDAVMLLTMRTTTQVGGHIKGGDAMNINGYPQCTNIHGSANGVRMFRSTGTFRALDYPLLVHYVAPSCGGMSGGPVWMYHASNSPCGSTYCVVGIHTHSRESGVMNGTRITPTVFSDLMSY